ncbi:hypothetical protein C8R43DRAFT_1133792 [Mycena crocata]|nr:hypothetical protein C8R43DRAFT_1133792 [Mycena crocata]
MVLPGTRLPSESPPPRHRTASLEPNHRPSPEPEYTEYTELYGSPLRYASEELDGIPMPETDIENLSTLDSTPDLDSVLDPDDEWKMFDEQEDREVPLTRDEMVAELEEMLGPDEEVALWECRA